MNSNTHRILAIALTLAGSGSVATARITTSSVDAMQQTSPTAPTLDRLIRRANRQRYQAVRSERDWRNPFLLVSDQGFELRSLSQPAPRRVALTELRQTLAGLPISDWPYGRVVVVQSPGIVPLEDAWIAAMERNYRGALEILKILGADEWGWPA